MRFAALLVLSFCFVSGLLAGAGATPDEKIRRVLDQQVAAWNRGDLESFVAGYTEHCTIVGSTISETTRAQVLSHYREKYPSAGARGKLAFSGLSVRHPATNVAIVTGHWHLDRAAVSGGPVGGVFSLVFELIDGSWRITLDHTS